MTAAAPSHSASPTEPDDLRTELEQVRLGQARLLRARTRMSCIIIGVVILYLAALIMLTGDFRFAGIWIAAAGGMVGVVFAYPKLIVREGVDAENYGRYLRGHIIISGLTGLVWAGLAIAFLGDHSLLNLFIAINMVFSITVGGMMPSAEYRPSFVALASATLLPFSTYWLVSLDGPLRLIGIGLLIYYGFGLLVSARAEIQTRATLAAERNKALTLRLQEKNALIEKVSAEKSRFLAATSHDLSQPLQAQGFFIGALRASLHDPEQKALLEKIAACWTSQQQLLQALVDTARLDSGAIIAKPRAFQLAEVLTGLQQEFTDPSRQHELGLEVDIVPAIVDSDPLLVGRILRNLLANAVKFTPAGGQVRLRSWVEDGHAVIEVADTGPGIPADAIERIFDEYVQLPDQPPGEATGLGLGLPIVRQLARKLDANLDYRSQPGEGTQARLSLPLSATSSVEAGPVQDPAGIKGSPLILLVEDDPQVREGLAILLTDWHCRVIAAESGADAIELLSWATSEPALLIVDKRLGDGEDGLETIAELRAELAADTPAIVLTGDVYQFEKLSGLPDVTVVTKPADPARLQAVLREILARDSVMA